MKSIHLYKITILALFFTMACADLDDLAPVNEIPTDQAIVNKASAIAAVNGIYDAMQPYPLSFDGWLGLPQYFSDEADMTGTFPTRLEFDNFNVYPSNSSMADVWTGFYVIVNVANNVIGQVPGIVDAALTAEEKADFVAQAKFARAQTYLYLATMWKEVPLILQPTRDIGESLFMPKNSSDEIYAQIIQDFTDASRDLLAETGPNTASKQAANAFLARVYLYRGNWLEAKTKALEALGPAYELTATPYLQDQIYSLGFIPTDGNYINFFYGPAELGGRYEIGPSQTLINAFEPGDLRFDKTVDVASASVPFVVKYPSFNAGPSGTATDPILFIRHAEMVLIVAEAVAEMGDFDIANMYFNQVRQRAGLPDFTLDASNFVEAILHERFVEFAFEGPFRLIDLRRKGKALEKLGPVGYDPCDDLWPLPQREVDRNPKLVQNNCCNC